MESKTRDNKAMISGPSTTIEDFPVREGDPIEVTLEVSEALQPCSLSRPATGRSGGGSSLCLESGGRQEGKEADRRS